MCVMKRLLFVAVLALGCLLTSPAQAKGKPNKNKHHAAASRFEPQHVEVILGYYGGGAGNLPPGLARRAGNLPPGLEKQLRRNGQLPPGLQKRLTPFPVALERRLPPPPPGCRRVILDSWALLIQDSGNVILDILDLTRRR